MSKVSKSATHTPSNTQKDIPSRRKLIKTLAAGSGVVLSAKALPQTWTRPAVDAVLLPAHAQVSCGQGVVFAGETTLNEVEASLQNKLLDLVAPRAVAQAAPYTAFVALCIECNGDGTVDILGATRVREGETPLVDVSFSGNNVPLNQQTVLPDGCDGSTPDVTVSILVTSVNGSAQGSIEMTVVFGTLEINLDGAFTLNPVDRCALQDEDMCVA